MSYLIAEIIDIIHLDAGEFAAFFVSGSVKIGQEKPRIQWGTTRHKKSADPLVRRQLVPKVLFIFYVFHLVW